jgi:GxxExxY protein
MSEKQIPIIYKKIALECGFRADIIVENSIILELKAVGKILPIHQAQLITYLKLTGFKIGFIFNFNVIRLKDGIRRIML